MLVSAKAMLLIFSVIVRRSIKGQSSIGMINTRDSVRLLDEGHRRQKCGELEAAFRCYLQVLAVEPDSIPALTRVAYVCHRMKRYAEAAQYHQRALALDPNLIGERYNLGIAFKELLRLLRPRSVIVRC